MRWRRFTVTVPERASEAVSALMHELFDGIAITSVPTGLAHQAYVAEMEDVAQIDAKLKNALANIPPELLPPDAISIQADWIQDTDWSEAWKEHYRPMRVGQRLVIVPLWRSWPDPESPIKSQPDDLVIRMDPGMAFGTGSHPTTRMCLIALEDYLKPGDTVIDMGCGSGILTIAAKPLPTTPRPIK